MKTPLVSIENLIVKVGKEKVLDRCSLKLNSGSTYFLMGPNGAGKSSLAYAFMGHPDYKIKSGSIFFEDQDITKLQMFKRARLGLFLGVQSPPVIEGVSVFSFLKEAYRATVTSSFSLLDLHQKIVDGCGLLKIETDFLDKSLNDGFSGGEKKKIELLQMIVLQPKFAILDEIDSGLDIDSQKLVSTAIDLVRKENPNFTVLIISHSTRLLAGLSVDCVHVMAGGKIVSSGDVSLAKKIEQNGYNGQAKDLNQ